MIILAMGLTFAIGAMFGIGLMSVLVIQKVEKARR